MAFEEKTVPGGFKIKFIISVEKKLGPWKKILPLKILVNKNWFLKIRVLQIVNFELPHGK